MNTAINSLETNTAFQDPIFETDTFVTMHTSAGDIRIALFPKVAPIAVENFVKLAETDYYTNTIFHRIIPNFMIQGGDPQGTGRNGRSFSGKPFQDEFHEKVTFNVPFLLAMANRGPNTNGSQFFITVAKTPWLDNKHTIFGAVVDGFDTVRHLESTGSQSGTVTHHNQITGITIDSK